MENMDLNYICTVIGNLCGIPIRLFRDGELSLYYSMVELPRDPMSADRQGIFDITAHVGYFVTPFFDYYGIVNAGNVKLVIGPTRQISLSDQELRELAFRSDVLPGQVEAFVTGMKSIVHMPLESVMQMLCVVNYILNGERLGLEDIAIYDAQQQDLKKTLVSRQIARQFEPEEETVSQVTHNTLALEHTLMDMVQKGDSAALREWLPSAPAVRAGVMAPDQLRQAKNAFIVTATLVSRAAIRGGMETEDAFSLSDSFIQKCELLNDISRIMNLQYHMVLDFTERVEKLRQGENPSRLTIWVANYVQRHLSEPITAEEIARQLFLSRPYLSARFREEAGVTLTDFVLHEKTEEAKRLLRYSDKPLLSIGAYLGFSSQSHFSRAFKKYAGCSPREYRERYGK